MENEGYHTAQKTVDNDICPLCDRVILSFNDLFIHIKCDQCTFVRRNEEKLSFHVKTIHEMNSKKSCATLSDHTAEGGWETCIGVL